VTVGPRLNPVTWASISNWSSTVVSDSTTRSLAALRARCGLPGSRIAASGRVLVRSARREDRGIRCGVGDVAGQRQLLDALRDGARRRRLERRPVGDLAAGG